MPFGTQFRSEVAGGWAHAWTQPLSPPMALFVFLLLGKGCRGHSEPQLVFIGIKAQKRGLSIFFREKGEKEYFLPDLR